MNTPRPQGAHRSAGARLRRNSLLLSALILYLLCCGVLLFQIDKSLFQRDKGEIMRQPGYRNELYDRRTADTLSSRAEMFLREYSRRDNILQIERLREQVQDALNQFMDSSPFVFSVSIVDGEGKVLIGREDLERQRKNNNASNTLFLRNFRQRIATAKWGSDDRILGEIVMVLTSPVGNEQIEELAVRYRWISLGVIATISVVFVALVRGVLLPVRRVVALMDRPEHSVAPIIPAPGALLEHAYNSLARDATVSRISIELRSRVANEGITSPSDIYGALPGIASANTSIDGLQVWSFSRDAATGQWHCDRRDGGGVPGIDDAHFEETLVRMLEAASPFEDAYMWARRVLHYRDPQGAGRPFFCDLLDARDDHIGLMVIHTMGTRKAPPSNWWVDFYGTIGEEVRFAISQARSQRRMILQEKSKANISLSRNLGHDLTNIIATSKLELMTLRTIASKGADGLAKSPAKEQIFRETLDALLNNTKFLQEIVNLYRSFSYLQRPRFEPVSISELVSDVLDLFRLSLSKSFTTELQLADDIPVCVVEPRLLRLALFNLLTNATDALKRASSADKPEGGIILSTGYNIGTGQVEIRVADTGPGIRDEHDQLLTSDSLQQVFRLGYTTKKEQEGEGLGLNWVQTIVTEFHGGTVSARNREEGGAEFCIRLPLGSSRADAEKISGAEGVES